MSNIEFLYEELRKATDDEYVSTRHTIAKAIRGMK